MKIRIIQTNAVAALLEVAPVDLRTFQPELVLSWLFRQFNAVDGDELISLMGVRMPSLSVGDFVEFEHIKLDLADEEPVVRRFECAPFGWEEVCK